MSQGISPAFPYVSAPPPHIWTFSSSKLPVEPGRSLGLRGGTAPVPCRSGTRSAPPCGRLPRAQTPNKTPRPGCLKAFLLPSLLSDSFPSDRVVSEDTGDGGGGPISSPIGPSTAAPRLASCLCRAGPRIKGVSSAHHEEVGELSCGFPGPCESLWLAIRGRHRWAPVQVCPYCVAPGREPEGLVRSGEPIVYCLNRRELD